MEICGPLGRPACLLIQAGDVGFDYFSLHGDCPGGVHTSAEEEGEEGSSQVVCVYRTDTRRWSLRPQAHVDTAVLHDLFSGLAFRVRRLGRVREGQIEVLSIALAVLTTHIIDRYEIRSQRVQPRCSHVYSHEPLSLPDAQAVLHSFAPFDYCRQRIK